MTLNQSVNSLATNGNVEIKQKPIEPYIVSIGEAFFDMIAMETDTPIDQVKNWTPKIGGAPTNFCVGCAKLGTMTYLVSKIGLDEGGEEIMRFFNEWGIRLDAVQRSDLPTRDVLTTMSSDGVPNFGGFSRCKSCYADSFLEQEQFDYDLLFNSSITYTGTLALAFPKAREALYHAVEVIKQKNQNCLISDKGEGCVLTKVFVDINWRPAFFDEPEKAKDYVLEYIQKVDYVKATEEEASWLLGVDQEEVLRNPAMVFDLVPQLSLILITAGASGATYAYHNKRTGEKFSEFVESFPIKVKDTAGAGDSFNAGFFSYLLKTHKINEFSRLPKASWDKALTFAVASSALTCMGQGAIDAQPTYEKVVEFLKKHEKLYA